MEWQKIEIYDKLKKKPKLAVFWFEELKPQWTYGISLAACLNTSRTMGSRVCTHWIPLPEEPICCGVFDDD